MPIALAFFLSGAAALVLQVLWTRMLGHVLGASALAVSTVLTVFMGGLALGSHFGGRLAPRVKNPLLGFSALETAVGLYGLLVPTLLGWLPAVQAGAASVLGEGLWGWALFRFVLSCLVLLVPTTAMGATLPLLAQAVVNRDADLAEETGRLYAANTFGAVAGALLAGFHLIPTLGVERTVWLAAGIDLFVAVFVLLVFAAGPRLKARRRDPAQRGLYALEPDLRITASDRERRRALFAFAASGAVAMALEVLWTRALGVVMGASTYAFTLILVTFLVGLAGGAAVVSRWMGRIRDPLRTLARVEIGVGLYTAFASLFIDRLPIWLHAYTRDPDLTHGGLYLIHFVLASLTTLPATLMLGAVFPLVLGVLARPGETEAPGPVVGRAYAFNTLGAIVGSFAGGFLILPLLGVEHGLETLAVLACGLGGLLLLERPERRRSAGLAVLGVALFAAVGPRWDVERWTAGMFRFYLARDVYTYGWGSTTDIIYHRDGIATTVTVGRYPGRDDGLGVVLKVNGKVDASDIGDMPTQILSGLLPVLLHDDPKDALVIGYGSGVTPGALLQAPIERLWIAELEDAVYEASNRHFAHVNHRPHEDPRATLAVDDGRNFLLTRDQAFDLIVSEPSNPWMSGAASLFTRDFFEIAKTRLREGGVFLQWLQLYELSPESIHALARTFHAAFPYVLVFTPDPHSNDTFMVGSMTPIEVRADRVRRWLQDPKLAAELERARVFGPDDLVGLFFLDQTRFPELIGAGPINTDDNALIEFAAPRDLLRFGTRDASVPFRDRARGRRRELVADGPFVGYDQAPEALLERGYRLFAQGRLADARDHAEASGPGQQLGALLDLVEGPDDRPVVVKEAAEQGHPVYAEAVRYMLDGRDRDALAVVERDEDPRWLNDPGHAFLRAFLLYRQNDAIQALEVFERLLEEEAFVAAHPEVLFYAARSAAHRHRWANVLEWMLAFAMSEA